MSGHTPRGVPYALGSDPLIDYPTVSLELANLLGPLPPLVGTLPATPVDGQVVMLQSPGGLGDRYWLVRWVAASSAWVFVGGSALYSYDAPDVGVGGTFTDLNPQFTIPRPGRYLVQFGFAAKTAGAPGTTTVVTGIVRGPGVPNSGNNALSVPCPVGASMPFYGRMAREMVFTFSGVVIASYQGGGTTPVCFSRELTITPIWLQ